MQYGSYTSGMRRPLSLFPIEWSTIRADQHLIRAVKLSWMRADGIRGGLGVSSVLGSMHVHKTCAECRSRCAHQKHQMLESHHPYSSPDVTKLSLQRARLKRSCTLKTVRIRKAGGWKSSLARFPTPKRRSYVTHARDKYLEGQQPMIWGYFVSITGYLGAVTEPFKTPQIPEKTTDHNALNRVALGDAGSAANK